MHDEGPSGLSSELDSFNATKTTKSSQLLSELISEADLVGDVLKMDYSECEVLVHDYRRQKVGGLPLGCFLLATRIEPNSNPDSLHEDTSLMLLRITGQARLPNAADTDNGRFQAGQRVADKQDVWDADNKTDQFTLNMLRFAGVCCRVLGTFRVEKSATGWQLKYGADVSNFYSGRGLKVYKPVGPSLSTIVNFSKSPLDDAHPLAGLTVPVGRLRYASTERSVDETGENIAVNLDPSDLVARRTALFGMSRTGKSNTTKVIASSVFRMRAGNPDKGRVGQLIFDVNGEYANENTQDGASVNTACLKNVGQSTANSNVDDVITYGLSQHPYDPNRKIVKINFFGSDPGKWTEHDQVSKAVESLLVGKTLADECLSTASDKYISSFRNTGLEVPNTLSYSEAAHYRRAITTYRAILVAAGLSPPAHLNTAQVKGVFNADLAKAMVNSQADEDSYKRAGTLLGKESVSWDEMVEICQALRQFIADKGSGYGEFNSKYQDKHDGRSWHDERLTGLLALLQYANGPRGLKPLNAQHDPDTVGDYAASIVDDLSKGRLVIFDQSLGDPASNKAAAERIMWALFNAQKQRFVMPVIAENGSLTPPTDVLVYAEEAHNLLPANSGNDTSNVWSRAAKEGSKYRIGLVYATQEPSSIQSNIMKNTDNWFVAHLNNADETKEIKKYYDFDDFIQSILQVPDPGFLRMRTLSNPYIVPVQVKRFSVVE